MCDRGRQVGCAGTERRHGHCQLPSEPPVCRCHETGGLLVPSDDESDLSVLAQRLHEMEVLVTWNAKDVLDTLGRQRLNELICRVHNHLPKVRARCCLDEGPALGLRRPTTL